MKTGVVHPFQAANILLRAESHEDHLEELAHASIRDLLVGYLAVEEIEPVHKEHVVVDLSLSVHRVFVNFLEKLILVTVLYTWFCDIFSALSNVAVWRKEVEIRLPVSRTE